VINHDRAELQELREVFFGRTRKTALLLYAGFAVAAIGFGINAILRDAVRGTVAFIAGFALSLVASWASPRIKTTARVARVLIFAGPVAAVLFVTLSGRPDVFSSPVASGALAGFFAGASLGFDPEHPYAWLREKS
jgi:hypothetical protein